MTGQQVWVVGKNMSGEWPAFVWELAGVFTTREKAVAACLTENHWLGSMRLDQPAPEGAVAIPDGCYPLLEAEAGNVTQAQPLAAGT